MQITYFGFKIFHFDLHYHIAINCFQYLIYFSYIFNSSLLFSLKCLRFEISVFPLNLLFLNKLFFVLFILKLSSYFTPIHPMEIRLLNILNLILFFCLYFYHFKFDFLKHNYHFVSLLYFNHFINIFLCCFPLINGVPVSSFYSYFGSY